MKRRRVLEKLKLTEISGVDNPCQEGARMVIMKRAEDDVSKKLGAGATAEDYIKDFVNSDAPQFKGKSKKERIRMALGAFYNKAAPRVVDELSERIVKLQHQVAAIEKKVDPLEINKFWTAAARLAAAEARRRLSGGKKGLGTALLNTMATHEAKRRAARAARRLALFGGAGAAGYAAFRAHQNRNRKKK